MSQRFGNRRSYETVQSATGLLAANAPSACEITLIDARQGWAPIDFRALWRYRELLYFLAWRDIKVRYKQTLLGAAWAVLQPALMMVVFTIFLGRMAHVPSADLPYPLFVYSGLLPWMFFATAVASAGNSVVGSERLITKIYFPRLAIPFAAVGAALVDFCIAFGLLVGLMVWYEIRPGPWLLLAPVVLALLALAALGMGALLAALNVAYRDFRYVIPFLLQIWMFATPSVYMAAANDEPAPRRPAESTAFAGQTEGAATAAPETANRDVSAPGWVKGFLRLNPLTGLIGAFRAAVLGGNVSIDRLAWPSAGAVVFFAMGCFYFRRVEDRFADVI
jgi:lipopolysaccharide transport system permease protein